MRQIGRLHANVGCNCHKIYSTKDEYTYEKQFSSAADDILRVIAAEAQLGLQPVHMSVPLMFTQQ